MFNLDRWHEILDTLWSSKLRSILTAFSVAWGIFMLVFLLGLGNGLQNGVESEFADDATNSVWVFAGSTSVPHEGMPVGRWIQFRNGDVDRVHDTKGVDKITGRFFIGGNRWQNALQVRVGETVRSYDVRSVHPDHLYIERTEMIAGRFIDPTDLRERRKVAVIGKIVADNLFGEGVDPIGKWLEVNRVSFQVVGVFTDAGGEGEQEKIYLPIYTSQATYSGADRVHMMMFTVDPDASVEESQHIADVVKGKLAEAHKFSPEDPQAVRMRNNVENYANFQKVFTAIRWFVFGMGICTLIAGVIGVSNIMMIVVKERTREIGVRKALGASPATIVTSIVQESVFLTAVAGYLGLLAGVGALALLEYIIPPTGMFAHPQVDLGIALTATAILVGAGALAGLFPALAAAKVNPIEALREE
jgi:putative ABC transport system permease protein